MTTQQKLDAAIEALERIAHEKERVPVKGQTGVSGRPRYMHSLGARVIAERALKACR